MFTLSRTLCALVLSLSLSGLTHAAFSQVISFGDSLSDVGNVFIATTAGDPGGTVPDTPDPAHYWNGRFSNGPVWVEVLANGLGLSAATASNAGGDNYAWGGARTTDSSSVPSLQDQINTITSNGTATVDSNALYTVLIGGNDINAYNPGGADTSKPAYEFADLVADAQAVAGEVQKLIAAGAMDILIATVPDLGTTPLCAADPAGCTSLTDAYNQNMLGALSSLDPSKLIYLDLFTESQNLAAGSPGNGFTNIDAPCYNEFAGTTCTTPDKYLFWDFLHPTSAAHIEIGNLAVAAVVPVPAALPLMLSALMGLGAIKRARKA